MSCGGFRAHSGFMPANFTTLGPFFGFVRDELGEVAGRADKRCGAQVGKPRLDLGIGEAGVNFAVELVDDLDRCAFGRSPAESRSRSRYRVVPLSAPR